MEKEIKHKIINAVILADSENRYGDRITTFLLTYPRFIHSELMTHRMFSRNSASSRAIPLSKMIEEVKNNPFIPYVWQKSHKGMMGFTYFDDEDNITELRKKWLTAKDNAVKVAKELGDSDVTKQLCNRLLEPFMWHTTLVTATEYNNFFELRCPKYHIEGKSAVELQDEAKRIDVLSYRYKMNKSVSTAEPHIQILAEKMKTALINSEPNLLEEGEWHLPFGDKITPEVGISTALKINTARCARLSYMTFDNTIDVNKDIELHDRLLKDHHMSPFEHCCQALGEEEYFKYIKGPLPYFLDENDNVKYMGNPSYSIEEIMPYSGWCYNLKGFKSYRHIVENK